MDINGNSKWAAFTLNGGYHSCNQNQTGTKKREAKKEAPIVMVNQDPILINEEAKA